LRKFLSETATCIFASLGETARHIWLAGRI
jgi:hypothetical protein